MLEDHLSLSRVFRDLQPAPAGEFIRALTGRLAEAGELTDPEAAAGLIRDREAITTTAVKPGFAYPHAFMPGFPRLILTVAHVPGGTDWGSLDGAPTEFFFLVLGPSSSRHLRLLARISHITRLPGMLEALRETTSADELFAMLIEADHRIERAL